MLKNDPVASRRRVYLTIENDVDGSAAPRGTDFTDCAWLDQSTGHLVAAANALVNSRRELTFTTFTFTADPATDICTAVAHGMETGDGIVRPSSTGALPAGIAAATNHWMIKVDNDSFKLATSLANAYAGVAVDITDAGTGVHSIPYSLSFLSERGLDGDFWLQIEQAETNFDGDYLLVRVEKTGYLARSWVKMENAGGVWETVLGANGETAGDMQRFNFCANGAGKLLRSGASYTLRDEADTKDRGHGTITEAGGRTEAVVDDAT